MDAATNQIDKDDELAGDLLVGRKNIRKFLIDLGMPEKVDPSYLKKRRWPIGKSGTAKSASLIASKRRLARYVQKLTTPTT
jgi:hypothetical protein